MPDVCISTIPLKLTGASAAMLSKVVRSPNRRLSILYRSERLYQKLCPILSFDPFRSSPSAAPACPGLWVSVLGLNLFGCRFPRKDLLRSESEVGYQGMDGIQRLLGFSLARDSDLLIQRAFLLQQFSVGTHDFSSVFPVNPTRIAANVLVSFSLHELFMESLDCCES